MNHPLRVLIVEDCERDVEFLLRTLRKGGYDVAYQVVETPEAMCENLQNQTWDLITSDHPMPDFNEPGTLALAKEYCPEVPFVIVSGEIELNMAVSLMRSGAKDCIQKHEIARLLPAVERELLVAEQRREHQRAESALQESTLRFKEVIESSIDALYKRNVITDQYEYLSPAAAQLTGYSIDELKKQMPLSYQTLIHPEDVRKVELCYLRSLESRSNKNFQVDYRFIRKQNGYVWLQDRFTVLRDEEGTPQSFIGTVRDITEWKQIEESLISSHRQIQRILGSLQDAYVQNDLGGHITMVNPAAVTMFRYPSMEAMLGIPTANLYSQPQDREGMLTELNKTGVVRDWSCQAIRQDGTVFWVSANIRFIRQENGLIIGTEGEIRDIAERKQLEAALQASEAKYRMFVETTIEGVVSLDSERRLTFVNHQFASMLGYTVEEMLGQPFEAFMPEDHRVDAEAQKQFRAQMQDAVYERCFLRKNGARLWTLVAAKSISDAHGQFIGSFGMFTDINKHKQLEDALQVSEAKYRMIVETAIEGVASLDLDRRLTFVNRQFASMLGYTVEEMLGHIYETFMPEDQQADAEAQEQIRKQGQDAVYERCFLRKDGDRHWTLVSAKAISDAHGKFIGSFGMFTDINERKRLEDRLKQQATTDGLTGAVNRRYFFELADRELCRALRLNYSFALALIDIDYFKHINDLYGHVVGDEALLAVTHLFQKNIRNNDVFARFGGDEFVLLLPETSLDQARLILERLCKVLTAQPMDLSGKAVPITLSVGIASLANATDALEALIERADRALYQAKETGRNRVSVQSAL